MESVSALPASPLEVVREADDGVKVVSVRERLLAAQERSRKNSFVEFDVPGCHGVLVARYRKLPYSDMKKIAERMDKSRHPDRELISQISFIAQSCVEVMTRTDDGDIVSLGDGVAYNQELANLIGIDAKDTVSLMKELVGDEYMIVRHYYELSMWRDGEDDGGEDDSGESLAV